MSTSTTVPNRTFGATCRPALRMFFLQFKRSLDGTYHAVSTEHLSRYADEFAFRWNTREVSDHRRSEAMVAGAKGRRVTYKPLTGR